MSVSRNHEYPKKDYDLIGFRISSRYNKKYDAIIKNKQDGTLVYIPFGSRSPLMQQYKDSTGIGAYSHLDHNDKVRRIKFRIRFKGQYDPDYFSPLYFSWVYLW